jgi:two-component system, cell cycle response regulator DivK
MQSEGTTLAQRPSAGARKRSLLLQHGFSSTPASLFRFHVGSQCSDRRRRMKVLVIEDHPDMRDLLGRIVEGMGYVPVLASGGEEGLDKAIAEKPNLILLDMIMPVMDGREVARRLRANPETKEIPILATTALFRSDDLNACLEAGCDIYIVKPFGVRDLQRKIRELLPGTGPQP